MKFSRRLDVRMTLVPNLDLDTGALFLPVEGSESERTLTRGNIQRKVRLPGNTVVGTPLL